jgi:hypothetical protein
LIEGDRVEIREMMPRVKFGFRLVTAVFCGFVVSAGVNFAICRFGGDGICRDRIWPAATMLGTGFEGQLFAWSVTTLAWAALLRLGFYILFKKVGPVKYE